ncbi:hypothetical protein KAFR_0F02670 [Kazachstania africana CBS 2517]|uniref:Uncharacterized protein n=1 Tax=Kazachstania africana (strain ATCC 22294 / BCRC 22015 / CBS 2517 / CECT 1963 / NBRC 1671 / NRRL Y-8276) TaxID=1071382 RepID=H2AWW4_KAZAF|nr:hypothetical protein KAFR_0F02670 [Kazachstania africana CBS 2517]CCF58864.1 hypothetical protein KAFR_0F02670 [Kazachstania africana CBS 2517]
MRRYSTIVIFFFPLALCNLTWASTEKLDIDEQLLTESSDDNYNYSLDNVESGTAVLYLKTLDTSIEGMNQTVAKQSSYSHSAELASTTRYSNYSISLTGRQEQKTSSTSLSNGTKTRTTAESVSNSSLETMNSSNAGGNILTTPFLLRGLSALTTLF